MRKYAVEFIGTFFLVFTVITAVNTGGGGLPPLGIGAVLMVMIYAGGHVSGAHYNPAVSVAAFVRGRLDASDLVPYIGAQLAGGLVAALFGLWFFDAKRPDAFEGKDLAMAFVVELLFTFALCWVVLNVATSKDHPNNSFYGLAIGFTVVAGAVAVGGISGGLFNPAVGFGIAIAGMYNWVSFIIMVIAQLIAGAAAGMAFKAINADDA
ncbi:MAG: aquaporin [Nocardioides sp.]|jgi:aquaporin Z